MRDGSSKRQVYYDNATFVWSANLLNQNIITITRHDATFTLKTHNDSQGWFNPFNMCTSMGKIIKEQLTSNDHVISMNYTFDNAWLDPEPLFITWDYEQKNFKFLEF